MIRASTPEVLAERQRCWDICQGLAEEWQASAARIRLEGSFTTRSLWPPFKKVTVVLPGWEKAARDIEAAVTGLRTIQILIGNGSIIISPLEGASA